MEHNFQHPTATKHQYGCRSLHVNILPESDFCYPVYGSKHAHLGWKCHLNCMTWPKQVEAEGVDGVLDGCAV